VPNKSPELLAMSRVTNRAKAMEAACHRTWTDQQHALFLEALVGDGGPM